jgi:hypothetical protein
VALPEAHRRPAGLYAWIRIIAAPATRYLKGRWPRRAFVAGANYDRSPFRRRSDESWREPMVKHCELVLSVGLSTVRKEIAHQNDNDEAFGVSGNSNVRSLIV